MFDFLFNKPTPFPESGSRKRFHASGMRGIDFSHKITPIKVIFLNLRKKLIWDPAMIVDPAMTPFKGGV
jgi:hypothetical protein